MQPPRRHRRLAVVVVAVAALAGAATVTDAQVDLAVDDTYATGVDQVLDVAAPGVLANDAVDPAEVDALAATTDPANGTVDLADDGSFTYAPDPGFVGTDTFTYTVSTGGATGPVELHPDLAAPTVAARFGDEVLFFADDGVIGSELWATDGTVAGTRLVADINPGGVASDAIATDRNEDLVVWGDHLYFPADGPDGVELWRSDGTTAGTEQVVDLVGGPGDSGPSHLAVVDDTLLFWASTTGDGLALQDRTLWALATPDGTPIPQHQAQPGTRIGHPSVVLDTGLVYAWDNELYRWSNGGTTIITPPAADEAVGIVRVVEVGGQAVVELPDAQFAEAGIWLTDGVSAQEVVDDPTRLAGASDTHAFLQTPGAAPRSLDLAGTLTAFAEPDRIATLPDPDTTSPGNTARLGDRALLLGGFGLVSGGTPWISDGTAAGTEPLLADTGTTTTAFLGAASADGSLWFSFDGVLYRSDGTPTGTTPVLDHGSPGMVPVDGGTFLFHHLRGPSPGDQNTAWAIPYDRGVSDTATVTITVGDPTNVDVDEPVGVDDDVTVTLGAPPLRLEVTEQVTVSDDVATVLAAAPTTSGSSEPVGVSDQVVVTLGPAPIQVDVDEAIGVDDAGQDPLPGPPGSSGGIGAAIVDPAVVDAGDIVVITADGFQPGSQVEWSLFSDPVRLGGSAAMVDTTVRLVAVVPVDTAPGSHTVVGTGTGLDGGSRSVQATLQVRAADGVLPTTGGWLGRVVTLAMALLLVGALVALAARTRRSGWQ